MIAVIAVIIGWAVIVPTNKSFADLPAPTKALPRFFTFEVDDAASPPILVIPSAASIASLSTSLNAPLNKPIFPSLVKSVNLFNTFAASSNDENPFKEFAILPPFLIVDNNSPIFFNCFNSE